MTNLQLCLSTMLVYMIFVKLAFGLTAEAAVINGALWIVSFYVSLFLHSHKNKGRR